MAGRKRSTKEKKGKVVVQQDGVLMLNNPLIPPELDEDIDDDLAFDSEDERLYGNFFSGGNTTQSKASKQSKKLDETNELDERDADEDYIDLEEMLDMNLKEERQEKKSQRQVQSEAGAKLSKKKRASKDPQGTETLFPDVEHPSTFNTALQKMMKSTSKKSAAVSRLTQALENTHNLISVDVDEKVKDAVTRKKVREITEENMRKYKPLLHDLNKNKHLVLPLPTPESNPLPASIGAMVATSQARAQANDRSTPNKKIAYQLTSKMESLLSGAGLSSSRTSSANTTSADKIEFQDEQFSETAPTMQYMSKLKAMLAGENSRRKRLNKIKSKTYRRILRKEKERDQEKRQKALELLNPELARKRLAAKLIRARAEERMTQKHKNTSLWVKHAKKYAQFDGNAKDAINEQLSRHQQLMQKLEEEAGEENFNLYAAEKGDENSEEEDQMVDELLHSSSPEVGNKLAKQLLSMNDESGPTEAISKARQELREMKFMKVAKEREMKKYTEEFNKIRKEVLQEERGSEEDAEEDSKQKVTGRIQFRKDKDAVENIVLRGDSDQIRLNASNATSLWTESEENLTENGGEFAGNRVRRHADSARVAILPESSKAGQKRRATESSEEKDEEDPSANAGEAFIDDQTYLVSRAFADDDVHEDFTKEKDAQVELMMKPEDINKNLPGWGEWGGEDERLNKHHQEKLTHSSLQRNIQKTFLRKSRADAALDHVIINHDGVELVPDRMTLHMVPRPFSNPQEFARSMRHPVGPEWTSALSFVEGVQPRVEVRQGHAVGPLDLDLRSKKAKTKRRKVEIPK